MEISKPQDLLVKEVTEYSHQRKTADGDASYHRSMTLCEGLGIEVWQRSHVVPQLLAPISEIWGCKNLGSPEGNIKGNKSVNRGKSVSHC